MTLYRITYFDQDGLELGSHLWEFVQTPDGVLGWALPRDLVHGDYFHEPVVDLADLLAALAIEPLSGLVRSAVLVPTL